EGDALGAADAAQNDAHLEGAQILGFIHQDVLIDQSFFALSLADRASQALPKQKQQRVVLDVERGLLLQSRAVYGVFFYVGLLLFFLIRFLLSDEGTAAFLAPLVGEGEFSRRQSVLSLSEYGV